MSYKGQAAYVFGKRYLTLKRPEEALMFFRTAKECAAGEPYDEVLARLAEVEIQKLEN